MMTRPLGSLAIVVGLFAVAIGAPPDQFPSGGPSAYPNVV